MDYFCQIKGFCLINQKTYYLISFVEIIHFFHIHLILELYTFQMCLETLFYFENLQNYRLASRCLKTSLFDLVLNANCHKKLSNFGHIF